jgi:hypothetical protein
MAWAAMDFLMRAMEKNRRRLLVENILLLLLRVLVVLLVVLALAQPMMCARGPLAGLGQGPTARIVVLDNSASMGAKSGASTAFVRAKDLARRLVDELEDGTDKAGLVVMNDTAEATSMEPQRLLERVKKEIDATRLSDRATRAAPAVREAVKVIGGVKTGAREIFVVTDFQRGAWVGEDGQLRDAELADFLAEAPDDVTFVLVDVGPEVATNVAVTSLGLGEPIVATGAPAEVTAEVRTTAKTGVEM